MYKKINPAQQRLEPNSRKPALFHAKNLTNFACKDIICKKSKIQSGYIKQIVFG